MSVTIGWDLGGANLKLASTVNGKLAQVAQIPCPIIPERAKFDRAVDAALERFSLPDAVTLHAVTMTGELSDVFANRIEGVHYLVALMERMTGETPLRIYGGALGFLSPENALTSVDAVASANWFATATLVAKLASQGLLVDIGTTTTDLIPLRGGEVRAIGRNDAERLTEGELVYTGAVRTPVMALAQTVPFRGRMQGVAAERFATLADVYRLTGGLPEDADPYPPADGRGKSVEESAARLARMLGRDLDHAPIEDWTALAGWYGERHLEQIEREARTLFGREGLDESAPVIGAGCGRFIAKKLATKLGRPYVDFAALIGAPEALQEAAAVCAPAVAVAMLSEDQ